MTLHEAAERLGVHYMTAYRYVRTGRLPAERDGAHWLIDPIELERLAAQPSPRPRGHARAAAPDRLAARLVAGDETGAWDLVESTLASGADPDDVLVDVIAAAMRDIGNGWAAGTLDVSDEHRATVVVGRIVGRMGPRFTRRGPKRGMILLGAPEGDEHAIPCAILADLLRAARFEVHDLGADTPTASFPVAADHAERLVGVMIGVTTTERDDRRRRSILGAAARRRHRAAVRRRRRHHRRRPRPPPRRRPLDGPGRTNRRHGRRARRSDARPGPPSSRA